MALKTKLARRAAKTTAKHTAHGAASKLKRDPLRTSTLLALGAILGGVAVWLLDRLGSDSPARSTPQPVPPAA